MGNDDTLESLLERAATLAAANNISLDSFMTAAWQAFVAQHPTFLEQLQAIQLCGQLELLRMQGRIASA